MDPMQNLNDAADAMNQLAARAGGFYDDADAQIAARQAAYDALADDLEGVAIDVAFGTQKIYVDADLGDDANSGKQNEPFQTFAKAMQVVRDGGRTTIYLSEGGQYSTGAVSADVSFQAPTTITIARLGSLPDTENKPTLTLTAFDEDGGTAKSSIVIFASSAFQMTFQGVDVICGEYGAGSANFRTFRRQFIRPGIYLAGVPISVGFYNSNLIATPTSVRFSGCDLSAVLQCGFYDCGISGEGTLFNNTDGGSVSVSATNCVATGATKICDSGTIGQNILTNAPAVTL
jgi:hypothetical protein